MDVLTKATIVMACMLLAWVCLGVALDLLGAVCWLLMRWWSPSTKDMLERRIKEWEDDR